MRKVTVGISFVALAALGVAWHFKTERSTNIAEINRLSRKQADLQRDWRILRQERESGRRKPSDAEAAGTSNLRAKNADRFVNSSDDPAYQLKYAAYSRVRFAILYGPLFRKLGLSDAQIARFLDNKLRSDMNSQDIWASLQAEGLSSTDPVARKLWRESSNDYRAVQTALLGADGFSEASQFENELPAHECVDDLAGGATLAGVPLSPDQIKALTAVITQAMMPNASGKRLPIGDLNWTALDASASAVLTPEQMDLFATAETPGPAGSGGSRFMHQMTSLIQSRAQMDAKPKKP